MRKLVAIVAALLPAIAASQESSIPKPVLDGISRDLAELQAAVVEAQGRLAAPQSLTFTSSTETVKITGIKPAIRLGAAQSAVSLFMATPGQTFQVVDKASDWYAIRLAQPVQGYSSGWVSAADVVPTNSFGKEPAKASSVAEDVFRKLTEQASRLRDTYRNNPYIAVSDFAVNVGVPPSVSINFEFKK